MPVTMKQIAERVGLHQSTVSRILSGSRKEAWGSMAKRAEKIRQIAADMGYRPNASARATRQGRTGVITLVSSASGFTSYLPWPLLVGLQSGAAAHDCRLQFTQLADADVRDPKCLQKALRQLSADGLLIDYTHGLPDATVALVRKHRIPSIWLNTRQKSDCVHPDDLTAARTVTDRLIELGHRRIFYVDYNWGTDDNAPAHYSTHDRQAGYEQAMKAAGLRVQVVRPAKGLDLRSRTEASVAWLQGPESPTAVVSYGADDVTPVLLAADRLGLKSPGDLSVITFGGRPAFFDRIQLAMAVEPQAAMGTAAVEELQKKIEFPRTNLPPRALPFTLNSLESIAKPRGK